MKEKNPTTVVTVDIAGEEYAIRSHASPEYTRECAAYVDRTIAEILQGGSLIQAHKAGILAALAVTDQLFQARMEADALRAEVARVAGKLASDIDARLIPEDLASSS
ncbi:MAG: cell division protein ZapA [Longimicrobiales bacterium]